MKKRTGFLIFSLAACSLFLSCDWNYSKSPEVPHYTIPEKRTSIFLNETYPIYIITDNSGKKYYYDELDKKEILCLKKEMSPSGKVLDEKDYEIMAEDFTFPDKIVSMKAVLFNIDQWRDEQELKPYWIKRFESRFDDLDDDKYFKYEGIQDLNVLYEAGHDGILYATVNGCVFDMDIQELNKWYETKGKENTEIQWFYGEAEISDSPYGKPELLFRRFIYFIINEEGKIKKNKD